MACDRLGNSFVNACNNIYPREVRSEQCCSSTCHAGSCCDDGKLVGAGGCGGGQRVEAESKCHADTDTKCSTCVDCPPGRYKEAGCNKNTSCTDCPEGWYQDWGGQVTCKQCKSSYCPEGSISDPCLTLQTKYNVESCCEKVDGCTEMLKEYDERCCTPTPAPL